MLYLKSILSTQFNFDDEFDTINMFGSGGFCQLSSRSLSPLSVFPNQQSPPPLNLFQSQQGDLFRQISPNILPVSLLLYNEGSLHRFNVFQTKAFPQFNTSNFSLNSIELQFKNYFADIFDFGVKNIFDTSFINTLMYGFLKYLEYQANSINPAKIQPPRTTPMFSVDNSALVALIQQLDPKKLILGRDYRFLDANTLGYMESFMIPPVVMKTPNQFALYLKELLAVLENIKKRFGPSIPTPTPIQNISSLGSNQNVNLAQYLNSSSYDYLQQFYNSAEQLSSLISKAAQEKRQVFENMKQIDVLVIKDKPADPQTAPYSSAQFILSEPVVPSKP